MSNRYASALSKFLEDEKVSQEAFAEKINRTQAAVSRYATGERLPNAQIARDIDAATDGNVPFSVWQAVAMQRLGIGEAA